LKALQPGEVLWCAHCHHVTEPLDPGDPYPSCARCKSRKLEVRWEDPSPARPAQKRHRLPAAERDLRLLVRRGYWFCKACLEVTKRNEEECCVLCGSSNVEWEKPALPEEVQP